MNHANLWGICVLLSPTLLWAQSENGKGLLGPDPYKATVGAAQAPSRNARNLSRALGRPAGLPRRLEVHNGTRVVARGRQIPLLGLNAKTLTFTSEAEARAYVAQRDPTGHDPSLVEARGKRVLDLSGADLGSIEKASAIRDRAWKGLGVAPTTKGAMQYYSRKDGLALWASNDESLNAVFERGRARAKGAAKNWDGRLLPLKENAKALAAELDRVEAQLNQKGPNIHSEEEDDLETNLLEEFDQAKQRLEASKRARKPETTVTSDGKTQVRHGDWTFERQGGDVRITRSARPGFAEAFQKLLPARPVPSPGTSRPPAARDSGPDVGTSKPKAGRASRPDRSQRRGLRGRLGDLND